MSLRGGLQFWRALRRYKNDKNLEAVLRLDWSRSPNLSAFLGAIEDRLHGEEITKLRQKQAEYLALQNQINPHFLYNALEAIRADALLADCEEIAETTEALATFFRYTISNVQEYVTFSDEPDNAENYFTIQRCRFGDKLSLELEMENENPLEARMPKLILQPLVENAVSHGLEGKIKHGTVRIIVENSEQTLFLRVRDDGIGMPEERLPVRLVVRAAVVVRRHGADARLEPGRERLRVQSLPGDEAGDGLEIGAQELVQLHGQQRAVQVEEDCAIRARCHASILWSGELVAQAW